MLATTAVINSHDNLDISLLLKAADSNKSAPPQPQLHPLRSISAPSSGYQLKSPFCFRNLDMGTKRNMAPHPTESPAKKQSKWCAEEDSLIIELRGKQMKWEDISKRLPGRSAISCRLHYQNYLERRSEWDEEKKNKLARLYERFKPEIWARVAEEMAVPWRAAEAMHWQLGEADMARRAGVTPFTLSSSSIDIASSTSTQNKNNSLPQNHTLTSDGRIQKPYTRSQSMHDRRNKHRNSHSPQPSNQGQKQGSNFSNTTAQTTTRSESIPRSVPPGSPSEGIDLSTFTGMGRGTGLKMLPSVAEMTTGASPYNTPAYATSGGVYQSLGPTLPAIGTIESPHQNMHYHQWPEINRKHSDGRDYREISRRQ
ncbi:hypothetical protein K3495_g724 [Podosphaera aphanis]|nr:hypothetical protein K3495_g724 [Podosphaera aphanis]